MGLVRTVLGDIAAETAGPTLAHEHLIIDSLLVESTMPHIHLPSVEEAIAETALCLEAGVRTMVDAMPVGSGRDADKLARIAEATGMNIVATTGMHTIKYYGEVRWAHDEPVDLLAERFIADIEVGMDRWDYRGPEVDRTDHRAGLIKVATMTHQLTAHDVRVFEAAATAHDATGVPILTHTEGGLGGVAQLEALAGFGVDPARVALSHTDKVKDTAYHLDLLASGASVCFDQPLRDPDGTAALVDALASHGFIDRIVLGTDGARRSLWSTLGGEPGLAWLFSDFPARIGVEPSVLFVDNPARWLALSGS
jgi:phosphotriesterase-related protein